jgi:hypothetical protein
MSPTFEEAQAAIEIMRIAEALVADEDQCSHPAEALVHVEIMLAFQCSQCGMGVPDESVARYLEQRENPT